MKKKKPSSDRRNTAGTSNSSATFTAPSDLLSHSLTVRHTSLKSLIHSLSFPSSSPLHSLPSTLYSSIASSLSAFKENSPPFPPPNSPSNSPPRKKTRLDSLTSIKTYTYLTRLLFSHPNRPFSPDLLLPCVQSLHDSLILFESDESLLFQISSLCEDWWKEKLDGKELLLSQSLPYFLSRALNLGKKSDVKRLFSLREAYEMLDYEDESIIDVKMLLLRCIIAPIFLKIEEGTKFLSFVLGLNSQLTKEALELIKSQIPIGKKSVLVAYGEIIFRAWKGEENDNFVKEEIEKFLQVLIEGSIHARSRVLGANIKRVLEGFIKQRTVTGVEKLIFRLTEPILFRSLQASSSDVRYNTLNLFIEIFPILDPNSTREEKDSLLEKQLFFLEKLQNDPCPEIRSLSIEGLFKILHLFWEITPSSNIAKMLTKVFDEMILDSCNEVRVSCLNGVRYLVGGNVQSHEIMRVLLVKLGKLVLDKVSSVRVSAIDLLLTVRDIKSLQFNKIVSLDSLLSLLANDQKNIAKKITKLLIPSYFPSKKSLKDSIIRCISLIKKHPFGGARFCEFLFSEGSSAKSLIELIKLFLALIFSKDSGLNQEQTDGLIIAINNVVNSLVNEGDICNLDPIKGIITIEKFEILKSLVSSNRACDAVLNIANSPLLNCDNTFDLIKLRDFCMEIILNSNGVLISEDLERQNVILAAQKLIFKFEWPEFMFENLANVLESSQSNPKPKKRKAQKRESKSRISKSVISKPGFDNSVLVAWQMEELVKNEETKNMVIESKFSYKIFSQLKALAQIFINEGGQFENFDVTPILAYLNYAMCMSNSAPAPAIFDDSLDHVLNNLCQLLSKLISDEKDTNQVRETENMMNLCTSVLKFLIFEITSQNLIKPNMLKCINFASTYTKYISSTLKINQGSDLENSNYIIILIKSSFTYCSKLLNIFITDSEDFSGTGTGDAYYLTNNILDLVPVLEKYIGTKIASVLVPVAKEWVPLFLLGLTGPKNVNNNTDIPFWVSSLAEINLERENEEQDHEVFSNFEKFMDKFVILLKKGSDKLLDSISFIFISFLKTGLEKGDYKLVFGLTRFVCFKLLGDFDNFDKFELMHEAMHELIDNIEMEIRDSGFCEEGIEIMENVKEIIRSVLKF